MPFDKYTTHDPAGILLCITLSTNKFTFFQSTCCAFGFLSVDLKYQTTTKTTKMKDSAAKKYTTKQNVIYTTACVVILSVGFIAVAVLYKLAAIVLGFDHILNV